MPRFEGTGVMGELIQARDWGHHPLGPREQWPQSLQLALQMILPSRYPMFIAWGPELTMFYNDAYIPVLGKRHPDALGCPANKVWQEIWEVVGAQFAIVLHEKRATWNDRVLLTMERNGYPEDTYFTFSYSPLTDERGEVVGLFCTCMEETARVLGERRLQTLRALADTTGAVRTVDQVAQNAADCLAGNSNDVAFALLYLIDTSARRARLVAQVGLPEGHALAEPSLDWEKSESRWPLGPVLQGGGEIVRDLPERGAPVPQKAGALVQQAVVLPLSRGHGSTLGFVVFGASPRLDLDEAYQGFFHLAAGTIASALANALAYEEERNRAEMLAELDRAKTTFFNNVSHELRTPLTLMLVSLEDLLAGKSPLNTQEARSWLDVAHRNGVRLLRLVNTLLDFSRLEEGRLQPQFEPLDLGSLTARLAEAFRPSMERAGIDFIVQCPPLADPVFADREMWEKIVFNLLSNAYKFTFHGRIHVEVNAGAEEVVLAVEDTGVGIPLAAQSRLFERFYRVPGAKGRTHEGTGIGLALVNELARLHGGMITVKSEPGQGSRFTVTLPRGTAHLDQEGAGRIVSKSQTATASQVGELAGWEDGDSTPPNFELLAHATALGETEPPRPPPGPRYRILVVDDNADMRTYLVHALSETFDVETASNGIAAMHVLKKAPPDLVLTDAMMPRLDGFALLHAIRQDPTLKALPVILLSARAGEEARVDGLEKGADDYLVKPFTRRELQARLVAHLNLARLRREASDEIRRSEARFRAIFEQAAVGICECDPLHGRFVRVNGAYARMLGYTQEELIGRSWEEVTHPDDLPMDRALAAQAIRQEIRNYTLEKRFVRKDGTFLSAQLFCTFMFDSDGTPLGGVGMIVDLTERKKAEAAVRQSELRFRAIFDQASSFIAILDPDGNVIDANTAPLGPQPFDRDHTLGLPLWESRWWANLPAVRTQLRQGFDLALSGRAVHRELSYAVSDSGHHWMDLFFTPIRDSSGLLVFILAEGRDITVLKATEQALRESGERLSASLAAAGTGIYRWDVRTNDLQLDSGMRELFAIDDSAPMRKLSDLLNRVHPKDRPQAIEQSERCVREGASFEMEFRILLPNGAIRWIASKGRTFLDPQGAPAYVTGACVDTTHQRSAQQAAQENRERLDLVIEASQVGFWFCDLPFGVLNWDTKVKEFFGFASESDVTIDDFFLRLHDDDRERVRRRIDQSIALQTRFDEEYRTVAPDGRIRWVKAIGRPHYDLTGQPFRFDGVALDVTEQVKARQTLEERRAELERLVEDRTARLRDTIVELESFSYSISHDMRAPLRAMQSFARILQEDCGDQIGAEGKDYIRRIVAASDRMDRLIQDVLTYSRISRLDLQMERVNLGYLIQGIIESYPQFHSVAHRIAIVGQLPWVVANEAVLTQCVSNLIGNAIKFVAPGVEPEVRIWADAMENRVRLHIQDNGIGIEPELHEKIFGIFQRLRREYEGTGIGLAVARKAAERMNGRITLQSAPGRGSTFTLELNAASVHDHDEPRSS